MALRALCLCDGYGGFELALRPFGVSTVARVERDSYAAAVLVERMAQTRLDSCPVWDDLESFDGAAWRGRVDLITAGFPCPDFSSAGKRMGVDGEHWLWPEVFRITCDVGPRWVVLENVPGLVRLGGLTRVLGDLASVGFDAEWGVYSAADVGAPHERERWWCVAHAGGSDGQSDSDSVTRGVGARVHGHNDRRGAHVGHAAGGRCVQGNGPAAWDGRADGVEATTGWPPGRDDHDGWRRWIAAGGPQPVLRRDTDGPPNGLADALHLGGNGLVPQAAREAVRQLCSRAGWELS